ncbi:MAG: proton-conducting transporter membrane subunit [Longimicrobiales bacterium]
MTGPALWTAVAVTGPLLAALIALVGRPRALRAGLALGAGSSLAAVVGLALGLVRDGPGRHLLGGWGRPLGIEMWVDGLTVVMLGMTAVVGAAVSVYATAYFAGLMDGPGDEPPAGRGARFFAPLWLFLWAALNALYLSADLFNLYVTVELFGLSAAAIITLAVSTRATFAGMRYLLVSLAGSMLFLLGVALLYAVYGVLALEELAQLAPSGVLPAVALAAMTVGMAAKTALFPLHGWLPPAHSSAPAPGSALLSALVVKASFYIVLRLWVHVYGGGPADGLLLLGLLGGAAILWGSVLALRQASLKRLIAYSTVAQVGYLFVMLPLLVTGPDPAAWSADAWNGGIYQAASHALAKAAMFLAAGGMTYAVARDDLASISGVARRLPVSFFAFALAGLTMAGIPPSGGFIGKWLLIRSALAGGRWPWAVLLAVGGLLAAAYVVRALRHALEDPLAEDGEFRAVPRRLEWSAMALAVASVVLGLRPLELLQLLGIGGLQPW